MWRIRLVAYGARLESGLGAIPQGFKSLILRQKNNWRLKIKFGFLITSSIPVIKTETNDLFQTGAIYNLNGRRVNKGKRSNGISGDLVMDNNPDEISKIKLIIYIIKCLINRNIFFKATYSGFWFGQFGHFLTETLTRFDEKILNSDESLIFHTLDMDNRFHKIVKYQNEFLNLLNINKKRIKILTTKPVLVFNLKILEENVKLNYKFNEKSLFVYEQILKGTEDLEDTKLSLKTFFSRPVDSEFSIRLDHKLIAETEKFFLEKNYKVVYPEKLNIQEQIKIARNSKVIAGFTGSSLHLSVFSKPGAYVLELGDLRSPTLSNNHQVAICKIKKLNYKFLELDMTTNSYNFSVLEDFG